MKLLSVQDISCYGQCSLTVALPIISSYGIETVILPSAVLSTHTSGFKNFTVLDLTYEMKKIINHWISENIKFDAIYTGYIGDARQFEYIKTCASKMLNKEGLLIVDPAMADNGLLYPALNEDIVTKMKDICSIADYIIPNITEASLLVNKEYKEVYNEEYINDLLNSLILLGAKNVILTGVSFEEGKIGAIYYNGKDKVSCFTDKISKSYHGTGDIFSSIVVANILNKVDIKSNLIDAINFVSESIKETMDDKSHSYGVKFEKILNKSRRYK